jgi:acyl carrier protein
VQIEDQIKQFIAANLLYTPGEFPCPDDASFLQEGIIDSMGMPELVEFVQKNFALNVAQEELMPSNFDSVTKLAAFIRSKLSLADKTAVPQVQGA